MGPLNSTALAGGKHIISQWVSVVGAREWWAEEVLPEDMWEQVFSQVLASPVHNSEGLGS